MSGDTSRLGGTILPTRIITYAWGEKYLDELLSFTLPALLAPGNLPVVAAAAPCEVVLLTEERFFSSVLSHRAIARIRALCPMRLVGLDDLLSDKDKYGMALTYALHRGFSDLGAAMTDTWLIFLNADFILADGALRNLLPYLSRGDRLIAAPSYCVNSMKVRDKLLKNVDGETGELSISPRTMASIILKWRHDTIRAKTVNQSSCHFHFMDQFYWQVDDHTLLGHQMPVAIAAMRPERYVAEPNSYWDYGLIREFCPESHPTVLGDSDDFLMLELRDAETSQALVKPGRPDPKEIGRRMIVWVTPYQREFAQYPLTLHDRDLPEGTRPAREKLRSFVDEVLSHCPALLPSHIDHPQWNYHRAGFIESRHRFLSKHLGSLTETTSPDPSMPELDRVWWCLDGMEKAHARARERILRGMEQLDVRLAQIRTDAAKRRASLTDALLTDLAALDDRGATMQELFSTLRLEQGSTASHRNTADRWSRRYDEWLHAVASIDESLRAEESAIARVVQTLSRLSERQLDQVDIEAQSSQRELRTQYEALLQRSTISGCIPEIEVRRGTVAPGAVDQRGGLRHLAARSYRRAFGKLPHVTRLSAYWHVLHPLVQIVDDAVAAGAADGVVVDSRSGLTEDVIETLPGVQAKVSAAGVKSGLFGRAFDYLPGYRPEFDIVVCDLDCAAPTDLAEIYKAVRPFTRDGGKIVGFYYHKDLNALAPSTLEMRPRPIGSDTVNIQFSGTAASARALRRYRDVLGWRWLAPPLRIAAALLLATPLSYLAARAEGCSAADDWDPLRPCLSITIDIAVRKSA